MLIFLFTCSDGERVRVSLLCCAFCGLSFTRQGFLDRHIRKSHVRNELKNLVIDGVPVLASVAEPPTHFLDPKYTIVVPKICIILPGRVRKGKTSQNTKNEFKVNAIAAVCYLMICANRLPKMISNKMCSTSILWREKNLATQYIL